MKENKKLNLFLEIILWVLSIFIIVPLAMVVITSFKPMGEANMLSLSLPSTWDFSNYVTVWEKGKIFQSLMNSIVITVSSVFLIILLSAILSFIIIRRKNFFTKSVSKVLTFGIIAPFAALPTIELIKNLGIYGDRISLVFVYTAIFMPFTAMLFSSFIVTIPRELDEAALLEGCQGYSLFFRIIFPLLKPVIATASVLNFMWVWNDFQYPLYLLNSSSKWTLPLSVYSFFGTFNRDWNLVCADMVLVSLPVIIVYIFAQKYIIAGMTAGAVKG